MEKDIIIIMVFAPAIYILVWGLYKFVMKV